MERRPNIILITADELKASAVSTYGNAWAETPHMARLAGEGIQFDYAFTTFPKCVPARSALLTGRYPHVGGHRTLPGFELRGDEPNLASLLKSIGYTTAMYGKNHWVEPGLLDAWFDDYSRESSGLQARQQRWADQDDSALFRGMYRFETYEADQLKDTFETNKACRFIREQAGRDNPFFLLMDISMPHPAYINISPYIERVRSRRMPLPSAESLDEAPDVLRAYREVYDLEGMTEAQWRCIVEAYSSMVALADHCLGRIMRAVDEAGERERTIVIFTSDHGDFAGEHGCVEKWDTMFYDCLVRVPLLVRYPGRVKEGARTDALTDQVDIVPTLLEWIGAGTPAWVQGESLLPVIEGERETHKTYVYCEGGVEEAAWANAFDYNDASYEERQNYRVKQQVLCEHPWTLQRSKMIRGSRWKLVYRVDGRMELYDLANDPGEKHDVSQRAEHREIVSELVRELLSWSIRTETAWPQITDLRA